MDTIQVAEKLNENPFWRLIMKFLYLALLASFACPSAYAIDQVILKSGQTVEGKVLDDVPNRHVDIELPNGDKRRFEQTEVASVERDVPSRVKNSDYYGNDSVGYAGINLGGALAASNGNTTFKFNYGARFGVNAGQVGDFSKFAVGLSFNRSSFSDLSFQYNVTEVMMQFLLRKIANSGFYFGPEVGIMVLDSTISGFGATNSGSNTKFNLGGVVGYDFFFNPQFSIGPEIQYTHPLASNTSLSLVKFLINGTVHF
jgi:hypothetical protein